MRKFAKSAKAKTLIGLLFASGLLLAATLFDPDWTNSSTNETQPVAYVAAPRSSGYLLDGSQVVYVVDYSSQNWSGNLHAYPLSSDGTVSATDSWSNAGRFGAQSQIDAQNFDTGRSIVTMNDNTGIRFRWSELPTSQKQLIDPDTAVTATTSPVLDFLRGDRSKEIPTVNGIYRQRGSVLGDIIHSTPVHWDDGTNRTIFVGANDGMLHAISATDGSERFAYIPSMLMDKLALLKDPMYAHRYFVDGQMVARKYAAYAESGGTSRDALSILVGGLGGGGRGLFALDIGAVPTSETDAASKILWEISNAKIGFGNLGHTYGTPILTKLPNGDAALLVGNGYNNTGTGTASLFIINPHTGQMIEEISTGAGSLASPNGLSSPSIVDDNRDGRADYVYAGDIDGNLWKFDLTVSPRMVTKLFPTTGAPQTSPAQAITMAPGIKKHPLGGYMVLFATGKNFTTEDSANTARHFAYGIWDRPAAYLSNNTLLTQTLTEVSFAGGSSAVRVRTASNNLPDWSPGVGHHMGWKTELPFNGERVVGDGAYVTGDIFLFLSSNPTINPTTRPPGENWWMQLNALTGGDNAAVRFDLNQDGYFNFLDQVSGVSPVGRYYGPGIRSQLTEFSVAGYQLYLANYDANGKPPVVTVRTDPGVSGGHFDADMYYGASGGGDNCAGAGCRSKKHFHQYDDKFDVTGINALNPSSATMDLSLGVPSLTTNFKVIASNQYLSPAVKIHLGDATTYQYNVDSGYTLLKNYVTGSTLQLSDLQTYRRDPATVWPGTASTDVAKRAAPKYIGSLAINMPLNALSARNWWGNGDIRVGLHPTTTDCVNRAAGNRDGNMYEPVIPPEFGVDGPGTNGYEAAGTTPATATGVRHNGALTVQIIKDTTPDSAIEQSVSGKPEYGWRVKSSFYGTYVLAEYTIFWHHPNGKCYGSSGWSKQPGVDHGSSSPESKVAGSTDPNLGDFGTGSTPTPGTTSVTNPDNSVTTTTVISNSDGTFTTIVTTNPSPGGPTGVSIGGSGLVGSSGGGCTGANCAAGDKTPSSPLGRVNWRELRR